MLADPKPFASSRNTDQAAPAPWKSKPRPKVRWSHQTELFGLKGREVALFFIDGAGCAGVLVDADQYTIKLNRDGKTEVFFKSALVSFREAI